MYNDSSKCADQRESFTGDCVPVEKQDEEHKYAIELARKYNSRVESILKDITGAINERNTRISVSASNPNIGITAPGPTQSAKRSKRKKRNARQAVEETVQEPEADWLDAAERDLFEYDSLLEALNDKIADALQQVAPTSPPDESWDTAQLYIFQKYGTEIPALHQLQERAADPVDLGLLIRSAVMVRRSHDVIPLLSPNLLRLTNRFPEPFRGEVIYHAYLLALLVTGDFDGYRAALVTRQSPHSVPRPVASSAVMMFHTAVVNRSAHHTFDVSKTLPRMRTSRDADLINLLETKLGERGHKIVLLLGFLKLLVTDQFPFSRATEPEIMLPLLDEAAGWSIKKGQLDLIRALILGDGDSLPIQNLSLYPDRLLDMMT